MLLIDLRAKDSRDLLDQVQKEFPQVLITALGTPRSEPMREAEQSGIYAAEDLQIDRRRLQALISRGFEHLRVMQENRDLREQSIGPVIPEPRPVGAIPERREASMPMLPVRPSPTNIPPLFVEASRISPLADSPSSEPADPPRLYRSTELSRTTGLNACCQSKRVACGGRSALASN